MDTLKSKSAPRSVQNFYVDVLSLIPFLLLIFTGLVMLHYHAGAPYSSDVLGINGDSWIAIHKLLTIIALPLIVLHLALHFSWLRSIFTSEFQKKHRLKNTALLVIFLITTITSIFSWLIFEDSDIARGLKDVHNKFGLLLVFFFCIHLICYFRWLLGMSKKVLVRK